MIDGPIESSAVGETSMPQPSRLHDLIVRWVREQPEALALRDAQLRLTYRELDETSRAAALQLEATPAG